MPIAVDYATGTEAVAATEWSLTTDTAGPDTDTTAGIYQLILDLDDMVLSDVLRIRVYEKARAGDTQRILREWVLSHTQGTKIWATEGLTLGPGWDFTLQAITGTITVLWSIRRVS